VNATRCASEQHSGARPSRKTLARRRPPGGEPAQAPQHAVTCPGALCGATRSPPRTALTVNEACESLGVGWDLFHESIEPELRVVRIGRRKLIPVSELQAWLDRTAEKVL
jgi:excisionase family DNA binding protein